MVMMERDVGEEVGRPWKMGKKQPWGLPVTCCVLQRDIDNRAAIFQLLHSCIARERDREMGEG